MTNLIYCRNFLQAVFISDANSCYFGFALIPGFPLSLILGYPWGREILVSFPIISFLTMICRSLHAMLIQKI